MRKLIILFIAFISYISAALAQSSQTLKYFKLDLGTLLGTSTQYVGQPFSSSTSGIYHLGLSYGLNINNQFSIGLGPRLDYFKKDKFLTTFFLQTQYNFQRQSKTMFAYLHSGIGPKFGKNFYAGNIFEFGLGWQFQPKLIGKKTFGISVGYNNSNLKNVYSTYGHSDDGVNVEIISDYYRLNYKSLALNMSITF